MRVGRSRATGTIWPHWRSLPCSQGLSPSLHLSCSLCLNSPSFTFGRSVSQNLKYGSSKKAKWCCASRGEENPIEGQLMVASQATQRNTTQHTSQPNTQATQQMPTVSNPWCAINQFQFFFFFSFHNLFPKQNNIRTGQSNIQRTGWNSDSECKII